MTLNKAFQDLARSVADLAPTSAPSAPSATEPSTPQAKKTDCHWCSIHPTGSCHWHTYTALPTPKPPFHQWLKENR